MTIDCPVCGLPLPAVPVVLEQDPVSSPGQVRVGVTVDLTGTWYARCRLAHPWCFGGRDDLPELVAA